MPADPTTTNAALEAQLAELDDDDDPAARDLRLVYADWLQQRGDPRGELIAIAAAAGDAEADAFLDDHEVPLLGEVVIGALVDDVVALDWRAGFIHRAKVQVLRDHERRGIAQAPILRALLARPVARLVRELVVGCASIHEDGVAAAIVDALAADGPHASVRRLELATETQEEMLSWSETGNLAAVWRAFPALRALTIEAGILEIADLGDDLLPQLADLEIRTCHLGDGALQQLRASSWHALDRLVLWFGDPQRSAPTVLPAAEPFVTGELAPNVTRLGLANADDLADVIRVLVAAPRFARLVELDLSAGTLGDDEVRPLVDALRAGGAPGLRVLDVDDNYLSGAALAALAEARPGLDVRSAYQRADDIHDGITERRYVGTGE